MVYRIGCDVGGTFTDLCLFEEETGKTFFVKTPTTTGHQATAVVEAARTALGMAGISPGELSGFAHGTTVATNAILERRGARTALLITRGFRDVLAIGRQTRAHLYDQYARKPEPLVPRELIYEIGERLGPDGAVTEALDEETVRVAVEAMLAAGIETVAISFLHSYANAAHEKRVAEIVRAMAPELKISISSDVLAEPGEFERTSTTVMNAYLMPPLKDYLERIANTLIADGVTAEPAIMQSGGGVMPIETASGVKAVHTCLSGPAAGMIGARRFAEAAGYANVVTIDMGGTSFDVGLIENGHILTRYESEIEGFPLRVPMFDIITLGAGGGSIAHVDAGGLLKVGPESAGARPGPAAYGKGGERPTVTDANVILGRLRPGREIGGGIVIDREKAARAIETHVAGPLGISVEEAAVGILQVVNAAMVRGMRRITVERGLEPRDFAVMAFGGAGPLHAVDLCAEMDVETVIVPPSPGLLCGIGLLLAPWKHDETSMISGLAETKSDSDIRMAIEILGCKVFTQSKKDGIDFKSVTFSPVLEMRYRGQGHQLPIAWTGDGLEAAVEAFHQAHHRSFGYDRRSESVEICLLRLTASAPPPSDKLPVPVITPSDDPAIARSPLWFEGAMVDVPVYDRARLALGTELTGPLIVEQQDTTLIVGAQTLLVDEHGDLIIRMQK
ncbi:hydantoinase/oxoprolinase family protein [Neorhizobium alkalisoli]|uniref:N-methylhydantoinase A n=1 Tax=Neorhizobium alkalisoli TaxID=528178 RepID=A0A561QBH3_9HYPH|nr:hydantoinase/oxoprolinase family protein [Neorhizobium alkalisoli]TWF47729.1 N-methylhydantoinase A [Neorhizobium alkalisoli]